MPYIPELKVEIVDLINKGNNLAIDPSDVNLSNPKTGGQTDSSVDVTITPSGSDLYGKKLVSYSRREPGKFFKNIPLFAAMDNLGKTVTGAQVLGVINSYWPGLIDYDDVEPEDMALTFTLGEALSKPAVFRFKESSLAWIGTLSLSVIQRFINLGYIVENGAVSLDNPSNYTMRSYYADYTAFAGILNASRSSGAVSDDIAYLVGRGLTGVNLSSATILYNGLTSAVTEYKVNTDFSHVLLLKPSGGGDKDVVYINYNYDPIPNGAITTENSIPLTDEQGRFLVIE